MKLSELLEDLISMAAGSPEHVHVSLATRQVDGALMEDPRQVWLREIANIEIDDGDAELKLVPLPLFEGESCFQVPISVSELQAFANANPQYSDFEVYVVDRRTKLADGGTVSLNLPILGVLNTSESALWILQSPQDQWPESWFTPSA